MRIQFANIILQLILFFSIFLFIHFLFKNIRFYVPKIGPDERLFPRDLIKNVDKMNEHRTKIAEKILKQRINNMSNFEIENPKIEIRIIASDRGKRNYLFQTAAFLIEQQIQGKFNLSICNVEQFEFEQLKYFRNFLPIFSSNTELNQNKNNLNSSLSKENQDYWSCLKQFSSANFVVLIEDDSLIISQFSNLLLSLENLLIYHNHIDFVKLYHPVKLRKIPSLFLNIAISIILVSVIFLVFKKFICFLTVVFLFFSCVYTIHGYGNTFPSEIRYYLTGSAYVSYPESCCTPSVIFRTTSIPKMVRYFEKTVSYQGHAKDHILDESPFVGRQSDLNYVTHIGAFSSVRQRIVHLSDFK